MKRLLLVLGLAGLLGAADESAAIRKVLEDQTAAWNRGDVRAFMEGYLDSPEITFVGKDISRGHAAVLARYLKNYPTKDAMGTLRFSDIEIKMLGKGYASVLGRFHLDRAQQAGGEANGIFTLVFHRTAKGWKVISDHTS